MVVRAGDGQVQEWHGDIHAMPRMARFWSNNDDAKD
jgi:hypothetical protein